MPRTYLCAWLICLVAGGLALVPPAHSAKGCCARHGGIASCDEATGLYRCKDGQLGDCPCVPPAAFRWSGKVVQVIDGHTLEITKDGKPKRIFLFGIVVPERSVEFGNRARGLIRKLVSNQTVIVQPVSTDQYGHQAAWVFIDEICVNYELLKAGLAYWDRKHAAEQADLKQMEQEAKKARKGVWKDTEKSPVGQ